MGGAQQPFLYSAESYGSDPRFPTAPFEPKAVTRASYQAKPKKKKKNGPLISVNRHPDMHGIISQRSQYPSMSRSTKGWIKGMRVVQLVLRVFELIGAIGLLTLMILTDNVEDLTAWVLRITFAVNLLHCTYAIYHLSRAAGGRTPGSSAAYHTFAGVSDLSILPLYAFGVISIRNSGGAWGTLLADQNLMQFFLPALYYTLVGAGGLHLISLTISLWLGVMFRRITMMPPDMNPLEDHLTSRASHKRNKSSVATSSYAGSEKRLSTPLEERRRSEMPYEDLSRPPSIPFMHTRHGSNTSLSDHDSRVNLPSRQYQIDSGNSPRNSIASADLKRKSYPVPPKPPVHGRGSYTEIPLGETGASSRPYSSYSSRPSSGTVASYRPTETPGTPTAQPRSAKFTEAWYTSESLVSRTQARNQAVNQMVLNATGRRSAYEAVNQRFDFAESDDEHDEHESKFENNYSGVRADELDFKRPQRGGRENDSAAAVASGEVLEDDLERDLGAPVPNPHPLRLHPTPPLTAGKKAARPNTPFNHGAAALSEISLNDRRVSGSGGAPHDDQDIADAKPGPLLSKGAWRARDRDSSIQPDHGFYSKPYGELKAATPPVTQIVGSGRQVSSGNDYDMGSGSGFRRAVSGKIAEEGRAGEHRFSRYGVVDE